MFKRNPHPMWVYDRDTLGFLAVNDAAVAHYGYSPEEFLSMTINDIRPAEDIPALAENVARYERVAGGLDAAGCWRHRKRDGSIIEVEITTHELPFGRRRGKVVLAHDVTPRRRTERAQLAVARGLSESGTMKEACAGLLEALGATMGWKAAALWMVDAAAGVLRVEELWEQPDASGSWHDELQERRTLTLARGIGLPGEVWVSGEPVYGGNEQNGEFSPCATSLVDGLLRGALAVPIRSGSEIVGVLEFFRLCGGEIEDGALPTLTIASAQFGQFVARKRAERQLAYQSLHDPLTGLPNRTQLLDRLTLAVSQSRRRRTSVAVLFLDVDRFKVINDSLGHRAGDELLRTLATRIRAVLRPGASVARFGGDEFVIIGDEINGDRDAVAIAERISSSFDRPFVLQGGEQFASASIGIALSHAAVQHAEDLVRDADAAMYRAKERGRGRYELFDELMHARTLARLRIENELRQALERSELRVFYQPIVERPIESVVGVEALIRWEHPERGLLLPGEFISVAEESGLIFPIGRWVLTEACRQAADWQRSQFLAHPLTVSVNVSPLQIDRGALSDDVEEALRRTGLQPGSLKLEITESVLVKWAEGLTETLCNLRAQGVQLVLDDFGTGYSALGYLNRFPIDALKIDRSFIAGIGSDREHSAIVQAVIDMATALGINIVAEGVETQLQADTLYRMGCRYAQGFHFARPAPSEEIGVLLKRKASPIPLAQPASSA